MPSRPENARSDKPRSPLETLAQTRDARRRARGEHDRLEAEFIAAIRACRPVHTLQEIADVARISRQAVHQHVKGKGKP